MTEFRQHWGQWVSVLIGSVAAVIVTIIVANTVTYVKTFNTSLLQVSGSATQIVTSDEVVWTGSFSVNSVTAQLQSGYGQMSHDQALVAAFLGKAGIGSKSVTYSPVSMNLNYVDCKLNPSGCGPTGPDTYTLTETVTVSSPQVENVTALAQNISPLINEGVLFSNQSIQYFFDKLANLRSKLLAEATKDALKRATAIVASTGGRVGPVVSVTSEPFQLTPVNSTEISNSGSYDTSTIVKKLTAIVVVRFRLP